MRILYVTDALAVWGGIERVLSDKARCLVRDYGCEVFVVTTDQGDHPIPFPLDERICVRDLNIRFHLQYKYRGLLRLKKYLEYERLFRKRMKSYLEEIKPDVICCIRDGKVNAILDVKGSIPMIFESHAIYKDIILEDSTFLHLFISKIKRKKFSKLDRIVTLTKGDADDWSQVCKKVSVIPNVVHLNDSGQYSTCENKTVIFVGRFDYQKDHDSLLKIWSVVQKRHPDWLLKAFGNGKTKSYFEKLVAEQHLNIQINPAVTDIFDHYIDSSLLVMTSHYEPFGLVLVEAMSCGLPVIAFNCPYGPSDIITDGVDGFIVEDRNIETFADRICQLIENPALRKKMGNAGVNSSKRYRSEQIMPKWIDLFQKLISGIK